MRPAHDHYALQHRKDELMAALAQLSHAATTATKIAIDFFEAIPKEVFEGGSIAAPYAGNMLATSAVQEPSVKKPKKERDPNEPKRPVTIYILWQNKERPKLRQQHPEMTPQEQNEELKRRWSTLSEAERQKLNEEYERSKVVYRVEKEMYDRNLAQNIVPQSIVEEDIDTDSSDESTPPPPPPLLPPAEKVTLPSARKRKTEMLQTMSPEMAHLTVPTVMPAVSAAATATKERKRKKAAPAPQVSLGVPAVVAAPLPVGTLPVTTAADLLAKKEKKKRRKSLAEGIVP